MKKLNCILLIDDNPDDNFFHERIIRKCNAAEKIVSKTAAIDALEFLKAKPTNDMAPELILLDINMPVMNGWDFLAEYEKLPQELKSKAVIVMLTTSQNPDDEKKAAHIQSISDFKTKPLSKEILLEIMERFFSKP